MHKTSFMELGARNATLDNRKITKIQSNGNQVFMGRPAFRNTARFRMNASVIDHDPFMSSLCESLKRSPQTFVPIELYCSMQGMPRSDGPVATQVPFSEAERYQ